MLTFSQGKQIATDMFVVGSYEDFSVQTIIEVLKTADDLYFNDLDSFLTDNQYDALKQYAQRLAPTDAYFTGVGSAVRGGKVKLPFTMGSLNQVYQGDYAKWVNNNSLQSELVVISDKLDGASNMILYDAKGNLQIAYSRGDGMMGADITRHISKIHNVPKKINNNGELIAIRGETIIAPARFNEMKALPNRVGRREYKNPRNMVSGLMNSSEVNPVVYQYIDVIAYEIVGSSLSKIDQLKKLKQLGFSVVHYVSNNAGEMNDDSLTNMLNTVRKFSPYELDGIVIEINSASVRERLKTDDLNPGYAVKFKVADASNLAITTVKEVEWNVSKDGYLKPRVRIEPVDLVGVTIQHATGFNAKFIKDNQIGPGAKIRITRSGDVIPYILGVEEPMPVENM